MRFAASPYRYAPGVCVVGLSKRKRPWAPSSGASAAVARPGRSLIKSRRQSRISLAQPRATISAQRDATLRLNIDIAMSTEELICSLYAQAL